MFDVRVRHLCILMFMGGTRVEFTNRTIVVGHYGSGKTEFALNLALRLREEGKPVTIVDLDTVNPYFRTNDIRKKLEVLGIGVIAPIYANTNLDLPALPPEIYAAFEKKEEYVIFDVGGDDEGATALGQYKSRFDEAPYEMLAVVNEKRPLTRTAEEMVESVRLIEQTSRLKVSALVNNTNLSYATQLEDVLESVDEVQRAAGMLGIPVKCAAVRRDLVQPVRREDMFALDLQLELPGGRG